MKISKLKINNFMGIKNLEIDLKSRNFNIFGRNATGKSTVYNAWFWLLFDKNSYGDKDFGIKTIDKETGEVIHNLEHSVEAEIVVGDLTTTLKKVYKEKWVKQRGTDSKELKAHTTTYWKNDVIIPKKDYQEYIKSIADEEIFKMLSNPLYFNSLHWKKQREILSKISGIEAIKIDSPENLKNYNSEDEYKKALQQKINRLEKEKDTIPARIDEVEKSLPELTPLKELEPWIKKFADKKTFLEKEKNEINKKNTEVRKKANLQYEKQKKLNELKLKIEAEAGKEKSEIKFEIEKMENTKEINIRKIKENEETVTSLLEDLEKEKKLLADKKQEWQEINKKTFNPSEMSTICPTCNQELPQSDREKMMEEMQERFNKKKLENKGKVEKEGKFHHNKVESIQEDIKNIRLKIEEMKEGVSIFQKEIINLEGKYEAMTVNVDYSSDPEYVVLKAEIGQFENTEFDDTRLKEIEAELINLAEKTGKVDAELQKHQLTSKTKARIKELGNEEDKINSSINVLEKELNILEKYIREKTQKIEEAVNSQFENTSFRMFKHLMNGGTEEICIAVYDGVPYDSPINSAGKIQCGLEIIKRFSEFYNFYPPIFIDNRESCTEIPDMGEVQIINLIVSPEDWGLRIEEAK